MKQIVDEMQDQGLRDWPSAKSARSLVTAACGGDPVFTKLSKGRFALSVLAPAVSEPARKKIRSAPNLVWDGVTCPVRSGRMGACCNLHMPVGRDVREWGEDGMLLPASKVLLYGGDVGTGLVGLGGVVALHVAAVVLACHTAISRRLTAVLPTPAGVWAGLGRSGSGGGDVPGLCSRLPPCVLGRGTRRMVCTLPGGAVREPRRLAGARRQEAGGDERGRGRGRGRAVGGQGRWAHGRAWRGWRGSGVGGPGRGAGSEVGGSAARVGAQVSRG